MSEKGINSTFEMTDLEQLGQGSSCIAYKAMLKSKENNSAKGIPCIVKKYCPQKISIDIGGETHTFAVTCVDGKVSCENEKEWDKCKNRFKKSVEEYLGYFDKYSDFNWPMIRIWYYFEENNTWYVVSEETKGVVLSKYFEDKDNQTLEKLLKVMNALLDALSRLEKKGIVLVDCKPENMVIETAADKSCQIRFFDIDGFLDLNKRRNRKADDSLPKTPAYVPLESVGNKEYSVGRYWQIACAGLILYYQTINEPKLEGFDANSEDGEKQFFGQIAGILQNEELLREKIIHRFPSISQDVLEGLLKLFAYLFTETEYTTCVKALEMVKAIQETYEKEHPNSSKAKNRSTKDDNIRFIDMEKAFLLLDQYPVFQYMQGRDLEVAILGDHRLSKAFFKVAFACAQVMDSQKNNIVPKIKLLVKSPAKFKGMLEELPEISKCISLTVDDKDAGEEYQLDKELSKEKLADISIYNSTEYTLDDLGNPRYILLLENDFARNKELLQAIVEKAKRRTFIAYLTDENDQDQVRKEGKCDIVPIFNTAVLPAKDMKDHEALLHRAYLLDRYYSRNLYLNSSDKKKWKEKYEGLFKELLYKDPKDINLYNTFSSIRSAVTMRYKIFSLHGNTKASDPMNVTPLELKKLLADESNLLRLMALEHRSWSAWLIVNGWKRLETYLKENGTFDDDDIFSWIKKVFDEKGKYHNNVDVHTALVACDAARMAFDEEPKDPLDKSTLRNREAIKQLAEEKSHYVNDKAWEMEIERKAKTLPQYKDPSKNIATILETMNSLRKAIVDYDKSANARSDSADVGKNYFDRWFFNKESAENMWNANKSLLDDRLKEDTDAEKTNEKAVDFIKSLDDFYKKLKPAFEYHMKHDFKQSDIAILEAMPVALSNLMDICVHRPITRSLRDNVFGILLLEPDYVLFIKDQSMDEAEFDNLCKEAISVLEYFGRDDIIDLTHHQSYPFNEDTYHVLDMTRVEDILGIYYIFEEFNSTYQKKDVVKTDTGLCKSCRGDSGELEVFCYDMKMMVQDASKLAGLEMEVFKGEIEEEDYKKEVFEWLMKSGQFNDLKMNVSFRRDGLEFQVDFVATKRNKVTKADDIYLFDAFEKTIPDGDGVRNVSDIAQLFGGNCKPVIITANHKCRTSGKEKDIQEYVKSKKLNITVVSYERDRQMSLEVPEILR